MNKIKYGHIEPKDKMSCMIFQLDIKNDVGLCCACFGGCLNKPRTGKKNKRKTVLVTDNSMHRAGEFSKGNGQGNFSEQLWAEA